MSPAVTRTALALSLAFVAAAPARAADAYVATGFPYLLIGVAQPVSETVTLRADWGTVGHHNYSGSTSDNEYKGRLNYNRVALLADWFVAGGFRLTGGVNFNQGTTDVYARSSGGRITIGGTVYTYDGDLTSHVALPNASPYLGIGWGHAGMQDKGLSFHGDFGFAFGKPKATDLKAEGEVADFVSADDLASENRRYQDGVGQVKGIPQLTVGVSYRF